MENRLMIDIVEGNLEDLMVLKPKVLTANPVSLESIYTQVLYHFLKNESTELRAYVKTLNRHLMPRDFLQVLDIRISYRAMVLSLAETEQLYLQIVDQGMSLWKAEALFVLALSFQRHKSFVQAENCFHTASEVYKLCGAFRKSLRCWGNAIAALSCHHPESFLIQEYKALYEKAFELDEWPACVGALINLSREFQRMGAFALAFEKIKQAESISEKHLFFSREHHLSLLQKAHLLHCLGRNFELEQILPVLIRSTYAEVRDSAQVLISVVPGEQALPSWIERSQGHAEFDAKSETDSLESELIRLLSEGLKTKEELIHHLYGDKIDFLTLDNRFKNILSRARKKLPGRIVITAGKYELIDIKPQEKFRS